MQHSIRYTYTIFNFHMNILSHIWRRIISSGKNNRDFGMVVVLFALLIVGWVIAEGSFKPFQILMLLIGFWFLLLVLIKPHVGVFATILLSFIPLSMGNLFKIPGLQVTEVVIPLITIVYFLSKIIKRKPIFVFKRSVNPLLIPILLYFGVIFANYLRNPLPPSSILGIPKEMGGLRRYYEFFLCFCAYFLFVGAVSTDTKIVRGIKELLWKICLILCLLGVVVIYSYPAQNVLHSLQAQGIFSSRFFDTGGSELLETRYRSVSGAYRIGTLGSMASVGLLLLLSGSKKVSSLSKWLLYGFLWCSLTLSGGRAGFVGTILAFCFWMVLQRKWKALPLLLVAGFIIYMSVFVYYDILPSQLQRIFRIWGSLEQLEGGRGTVFPIFWSSFLENPVFGVAMGSDNVQRAGLSHFATMLLRFGGHGTYLSLLYTTGLLGFIPFLWIYLSGIKTSLCVFNRASNKIVKTLSLFCLLYLIYDLIPLGFGGFGASMPLFMVFGIISGVYIKFRKFQYFELKK